MEGKNMKSGMRVIVYATTLLGGAQPGLAADCLWHSGFTMGNNLSYHFTLGIMVAILAVIFGLKLLHANKLKSLQAKHRDGLPLATATGLHLKIGKNFSKWAHIHKLDETKPTGA